MVSLRKRTVVRTWLSVLFYWRKGWDSNPRKLSLHTLSKRADSAALAPFLADTFLYPRVGQASRLVR